MRRAPFLVLAAVLAVAGCSSGAEARPQVTFTAGQASVTARPTQYCNLQFTDCQNDANAPVELKVPAGTPLQVRVPDEIASTPWQLVFTYVDANGTRTDERSSVFPPNARHDFTLTLAAPTDRLLTAQVQQFGAPPQANEESGGVDFPIRASWVLTTTL